MKKGILILTLLILALFSVSCIYASDVNDTLAASEDNLEIDQTTDDVISVEEDMELASSGTDEVLKADEQTFAQLNTTINGNANDTITLDKDYAFNQTTDSAFIGGIEISRPVTIIGNNNTIDGKGQAGIFWVTGDNVSINNIIFVNGYDDFDAGVIYWEGANGTVSGSVFSGNKADHVGLEAMQLILWTCQLVGKLTVIIYYS